MLILLNKRENRDVFYYILSYLSVSDIFFDCSLVCKQWFECVRGGGGSSLSNCAENDYFIRGYMPFLKSQHSSMMNQRKHILMQQLQMSGVVASAQDLNQYGMWLPMNAYSALSWAMFIPDRPYKTEQSIYQFMLKHVSVKEFLMVDDHGNDNDDSGEQQVVERQMIQINLPVYPDVDQGGLPQLVKTMFENFGTNSSKQGAENGNDSVRELKYVPVLVNAQSSVLYENEAVIHLFVDSERGSIAKMDAEQCRELDLENFMEKGYSVNTIRFLPRSHNLSSNKPSIQNRRLFQSLLVALGLSEIDESIPLATFILTIGQCLRSGALRDQYMSPKASIKAFDHLYIDDMSPYWFQVTKKLVCKHDRLLTISPYHLPPIEKLYRSINAIVQTKQYENQMPIVLKQIATHGTSDMLSHFLQTIQLANIQDPSALMKLFSSGRTVDQSPLVGLLEGQQEPAQKLKMLSCILDEEDMRNLIISHRVLHHATRIAKICSKDVVSEYHSLITDILFEYLRWQQFPSDIHPDSLCHNSLIQVFPQFVHLLANLPERVRTSCSKSINTLVNYNRNSKLPTPLLRAVLNFPQYVNSLLTFGADPFERSTMEMGFNSKANPICNSRSTFSAVEEACLCPQHPSLERLVSLSNSEHSQPTSRAAYDVSSISHIQKPVNIVLIGHPKCGKRSLIDHVLNRPCQHLNNEDYMFALSPKEQIRAIRYRSQCGLYNNSCYDIEYDLTFDHQVVKVHMKTVHMFELDGLIENQPIKTAIHENDLHSSRCSVQGADIVFVCYDINNEYSIQILEEIEGIKSMCSNNTVVSILGLGESEPIHRRVFRSVVHQHAKHNQVQAYELNCKVEHSQVDMIIKRCMGQLSSVTSETRAYERSYLPRRCYQAIDLSVLSARTLTRAMLSSLQSGFSQPILGTGSRQKTFEELYHFVQNLTESDKLLLFDTLLGCINSSKWTDVQLLMLTFMLESPSLLLERLTSLFHTLGSSLNTEQWLNLIECIVIASGGVDSSASDVVHSLLCQAYDYVRAEWLQIINRGDSDDAQQIERYLIQRLYDADFRTSTSLQTVTQTVLFLLQNGFLDDITFMNQFYAVMFDNVLRDQLSIVECDFVESVFSICHSRIAEQCLYLIKQYKSKDAHMDKVKKIHSLPIDSSVMVLVDGLTYHQDVSHAHQSANAIGAMSDITVPCSQVFSELTFQNEMNFLRITPAPDCKPRISWLHQYGTAEMRFHTNYDVKNISVSTVQMAVLLLFNDAKVAKTGLKLSQVLDKLLPTSLRSCEKIVSTYKSQVQPLIQSGILVTLDESPFEEATSVLTVTTKNWSSNRKKISIPTN